MPIRNFSSIINICGIRLFLLVVSTLFNLSGFAKAQATYFVSLVGNDNNPGTKALPFATIQKAHDVAQGVNRSMKGDIIIYLRGGIYELASTLIFSSDDSGTNDYNIIYQAYNNEIPIISGGMRITGWAMHDSINNIYMAAIDKSIDTRQLYVNGARAVRARSIDALGWKENGEGYDCPAEAATWKNLANVEVVSYKNWKCHRGPIFSIRGTHALMAQPYWTNLHIQDDAPPVWVENAYELLDSEGEWYLDRPKGTIYYKPRAGEKMANIEVVLPKLETLIRGSGVSNVLFKGFIFEYSSWTLPNSLAGFACLQADARLTGSKTGLACLQADSMITGLNGQFTQISGNIVFDHCNNIQFVNNTFEHFGATALQFFTGCKNNIIYNNTFDDISGSAISIGGLTDSSPSDNDIVKDNIVYNNLIKNVAIEYQGCVGVFVGYTEHTTITHNEIRCLPYSGISAGWGWSNSTIAGKNNEISYNLIDSVMMILRDGGGIYTLSSQPGANVHDNYINHTINECGSLYPDEGSSNMHWHHNVLSKDVNWLFMWTPTIQKDTVDYNYFDNQTQYTNSSNCVIQNNVFVPDSNWPADAKKIIKNAGRISN